MNRTKTIQHNFIPWPENEPTVPVWPTAGRALRMGRTNAYEKARSGTFPVTVIACGSKLMVATAGLRRVLELPLSPGSSLVVEPSTPQGSDAA